MKRWRDGRIEGLRDGKEEWLIGDLVIS